VGCLSCYWANDDGTFGSLLLGGVCLSMHPSSLDMDLAGEIPIVGQTAATRLCRVPSWRHCIYSFTHGFHFGGFVLMSKFLRKPLLWPLQECQLPRLWPFQCQGPGLQRQCRRQLPRQILPQLVLFRLRWQRLLLLLLQHLQFLHLLYRPRLLHCHVYLQRVSLTVQSLRRILHSSWSLHAPRHLTRLLLFPRQILSFVFGVWCQRGRESRFRGSVDRGFSFSLCATFMHHVYLLALHFVTCVPYILWHVCLWDFIIYHVTYLVLAHKVVLSCLTPISYELCFVCTNSSYFISWVHSIGLEHISNF
jgi:hypothetical protein